MLRRLSRQVGSGGSSNRFCAPLRSRILSAALALCLGSTLLPAATATWRGGSGDWIDVNDWVEGFEPGLADDAVFDSVQNGTGGIVSLHQTAADIKIRSVNSITFLAGAGSYTIRNQTGAGRKDLLVGAGGIVNHSTNLQVFDTEVLLNAPQTWLAGSGPIVANDIVQLGNNTLTLSGSSDITINGAISGTGGLIKDGIGTLTLSAPSLYTGSTVLNAGTITYTAPQSLVGSLILNGGVLDANDQSLTFSSLTVGGDATLRLGDDSTSQLVQFADGTWLGGVLTIENWTSGASSDQLFLVNEPSALFLSQVQFTGYGPGAVWIGGPVVPVPEPSTIAVIATGLLLLVVVSHSRKRRR